MENAESKTTLEFFVARTVYPLFFFGGIGVALLAIRQGWDLGMTTGAIVGTTALTLIVLEAIFPAKREWRMTFRSFLRDLKYIAAGIATGALMSYVGAALAIFVAGSGHGAAARLPLYVAVPLAILVFDFVQYWVHRWMHETAWPLGGFLWRVHAAHHLPDRLYVLMHPAAHPLNDIIVRHAINIGLIKLIGFNAEAVFLFSVITVIGGLFSHFNLDVRAGFMNYLFTSTELHRFHPAPTRARAGITASSRPSGTSSSAPSSTGRALCRAGSASMTHRSIRIRTSIGASSCCPSGAASGRRPSGAARRRKAEGMR